MSTDVYDQSSDALHTLTEQVFGNMKLGTPILEDLLKAATKYHAVLEEANAAAAHFVECLGRAALNGTRARGSTTDLGLQLQLLASRHRAMTTDRMNQTQRLHNKFITPLAKRLKSDTKAIPKAEEEFKLMRSDLKKTHEKARKGRKSMPNHLDRMSFDNQNLLEKSSAFEAFNQRCLESVLIEERRRFCYLLDNYCAVFAVDFFTDPDQHLIRDAIHLTLNPEELPPASEVLIIQNSAEARGVPAAFAHSRVAAPLEAAVMRRDTAPAAPSGLSAYPPGPAQDRQDRRPSARRQSLAPADFFAQGGENSRATSRRGSLIAGEFFAQGGEGQGASRAQSRRGSLGADGAVVERSRSPVQFGSAPPQQYVPIGRLLTDQRANGGNPSFRNQSRAASRRQSLQ